MKVVDMTRYRKVCVLARFSSIFVHMTDSRKIRDS